MAHETISVASLIEDAPYQGKPVVPWAEEQSIDWQLRPGGYTEAEAITVDITNTRRLLRVAGFSRMVIRHTMSEQDEAQQNMVVTSFGVGADGTAIATGAARRAAQPKLTESSIQYSQEEGQVFKDYTWPQVTINVDRGAMGQRISELILGKHTLSREQAWATTIDSAIRGGIGEAAHKHLMPTDTAGDLLGNFFGGYWVYISTSSIMDLTVNTAQGVANPAPGFNLLIGAGIVGLSAAGNKRLSGQSYIRRKRFSLSPSSHQPDRYIAARAFGTTHTFVNAR
jgi:hypothetical protein